MLTYFWLIVYNVPTLFNILGQCCGSRLYIREDCLAVGALSVDMSKARSIMGEERRMDLKNPLPLDLYMYSLAWCLSLRPKIYSLS